LTWPERQARIAREIQGGEASDDALSTTGSSKVWSCRKSSSDRSYLPVSVRARRTATYRTAVGWSEPLASTWTPMISSEMESARSNNRWRAGIPRSSLRNLLSGVRRYRQFREGEAFRSAPRIRRSITVTPLEAVPTGDAVLADATAQMGIDLVELVARSAIWANPDVVSALREKDANALWSPNVRRKRVGEKRGAVIDGIRIDDNSWANQAIKLATFGRRKVEGFHACHVWPASCYDPLSHTSIANLVLVPAPLAGLTDYDPAVGAALRYRAYELYGWRPVGNALPDHPDRYPAPDVWRSPASFSDAVRKALTRRLREILISHES
jgi:hypothetical protein